MLKDVTAIVPTIGEYTLDESIDSLHGQSYGLADIIVVRDVSPFPEAMNQGLQQVSTPFLLQCDADMILHPDCLDRLRAAMSDDTGVAIGYLHDELLGDIQAVKLYRTHCLRDTPFENTVATDSQGIEGIVRRGFRIAFAGRANGYDGFASDVLGLHRPNYSDPLYVYGKFSLMGSIVKSRGSYRECQGVLGALKLSKHDMADFALIAFCRGLFDDKQESGHRPFTETDEFRFLRDFSQHNAVAHDLFAITRLANYDRKTDLDKLHSIRDRQGAGSLL